MEIPTSNSLPSNLALIKSPTSLGISGSGSFQSHLSTGKSHQRLRIGVHSTSSGSSKDLSLNQVSNAANALSPPFSRQTTRAANYLNADVAVESYLSRLISWPKSWFQWIVFTYCCLSVIILSATIIERLIHQNGLFPPHSQDVFVTSALSGLSNRQRLSIVSSLHPRPREFEPFVLRGMETDGITACLWSQDTDIEALSAWASRWQGPISLLLTTSVEPLSAPHQDLLIKVRDLSLISPTSLSLHILYAAPGSKHLPNAYLNLARLFARTDHVILFPGNLSALPPPALLGALSARPHALSIISNQNDTNFPFPALAPVVVHRNHSIWCTERLFLTDSRDGDWDACLWQLWLDSFGDIEVLKSPDWTLNDLFMPLINSAVNKLRQRLSYKYKNETCILARNRLAALGIANEKVRSGVSKATWLKHVCAGITL